MSTWRHRRHEDCVDVLTPHASILLGVKCTTCTCSVDYRAVPRACKLSCQGCNHQCTPSLLVHRCRVGWMPTCSTAALGPLASLLAAPLTVLAPYAGFATGTWVPAVVIINRAQLMFSTIPGRGVNQTYLACVAELRPPAHCHPLAHVHPPELLRPAAVGRLPLGVDTAGLHLILVACTQWPATLWSPLPCCNHHHPIFLGGELGAHCCWLAPAALGCDTLPAGCPELSV